MWNISILDISSIFLCNNPFSLWLDHGFAVFYNYRACTYILVSYLHLNTVDMYTKGLWMWTNLSWQNEESRWIAITSSANQAGALCFLCPPPPPPPPGLSHLSAETRTRCPRLCPTLNHVTDRVRGHWGSSVSPEKPNRAAAKATRRPWAVPTEQHRSKVPTHRPLRGERSCLFCSCALLRLSISASNQQLRHFYGRKCRVC